MDEDISKQFREKQFQMTHKKMLKLNSSQRDAKQSTKEHNTWAKITKK